MFTTSRIRSPVKPLQLPSRTAPRERPHLRQHRLDVGHHVATVDEHGTSAPVPERRVERRAALRLVHRCRRRTGGRAPRLEPARLGQTDEQVERLVGDVLLRGVQEEARGLQGEALEPSGVVLEQLPRMVGRRSRRGATSNVRQISAFGVAAMGRHPPPDASRSAPGIAPDRRRPRERPPAPPACPHRRGYRARMAKRRRLRIRRTAGFLLVVAVLFALLELNRFLPGGWPGGGGDGGFRRWPVAARDLTRVRPPEGELPPLPAEGIRVVLRRPGAARRKARRSAWTARAPPSTARTPQGRVDLLDADVLSAGFARVERDGTEMRHGPADPHGGRGLDRPPPRDGARAAGRARPGPPRGGGRGGRTRARRARPSRSTGRGRPRRAGRRGRRPGRRESRDPHARHRRGARSPGRRTVDPPAVGRPRPHPRSPHAAASTSSSSTPSRAGRSSCRA